MTTVGKVSCWVAACWIVLTTIPLADIPLTSDPGAAARLEPFDVLPDSSVLVVELSDFADRWDEIRNLRPIARFQDRLLEGLEIEAQELPRFVGNRAVVALVEDDARGGLVPVAVLSPERPGEALESLQRLARDAAVSFEIKRRGNLVTLAPAGYAGWFQGDPAVSRDGLKTRLHVEEIAARLPEGGLVRGWLDPEAARELLQARPEGAGSLVSDLLAELLAAELEVTRFAGFRRDLTERGLETEAIAGLDTAVLPPELQDVFAPPVTPRVLPEEMPEGAVAVAAFGTESRAVLAWLRHVSDGSPRGVLRNLEFWLDELERGTGLDVERDLLDLLGERGWFLALHSDDASALEVAAVFETREAHRLERNLLQVAPWLAGQVAGRSLGLAVPRVDHHSRGDETVHAVSVWTPLGRIPGPRLVFSGGRLIVGSSDRALASGEELARSLAAPCSERAGGNGNGPNETTRIDGPALAELVSALVAPNCPVEVRGLAEGVTELLADLHEIRLDAWYEDQAVRLRGRLEFR